MTAHPANPRFVIALGIVFVLIWILLAIRPWYRADWLLENVIVVLAVPLLVVGYRRMPLSRLSYVCIFTFLCLHEIGAHYTYAEVPYNAWAKQILGNGINEIFDWERNHFDRLVHFLYGLLLVYPTREMFVLSAGVRGYVACFIPMLLVMSTSMVFELFEWGAAVLFGGELGMAYLGTQGDVWDSHQDMLLATAGALAATTAIAVVGKVVDRDSVVERAEQN